MLVQILILIPRASAST